MKRGAPKRTKFRPSKRGTARRKLEKYLDDLCREVVFHRDHYTCVRCGKVAVRAYRKDGWPCYPGFDWSHIFGRARKSMQWVPLNSVVHCDTCHARWHDGRTSIAEHAWFVREFPERYAKLELMAFGRGNTKPVDRKALVIELEQMVRGLGAAGLEAVELGSETGSGPAVSKAEES